MKFQKIGISSSGGTLGSFDPNNMTTSDKLNFVTSCTGEKVKWNDVMEQDAVNLVVSWELYLKHDNGLKVWDKTHKQHYRILDKENPPIDIDIDNLIIESHSNFINYLESERIDTYNAILPLGSLEIEGIRLHLLEVCNSHIQF